MNTRRMKLASVADVTLVSVLVLAVGLMLLATGVATAATNYTVQPILKGEDKAGDVLIPSDHFLSVEALNDNGQVLIMTMRRETFEPRWLFQYGAGQFTPIVVSGGAAPSGKWPENVVVRRPLPMNQKGNVGFAASVLRDVDNGQMSWGTFFWDAATRQSQAVALKGMPAPKGKVFRQGASPNGTGAYINDNDEIVFTADVSSTYGVNSGVFLRRQDGQLESIILPGEKLASSTLLQAAAFPKLNDAGMIGFWAVQFPVGRPNSFQAAVYLWEGGKLSLVAQEGQDAPGGGKLDFVQLHSLSNTDRSVLIEAETRDPRRKLVYRFLDGQSTPLLEVGTELTGVGKLKEFTVTGPDDAGRYTFAALLEDGSTGLYQLVPGGTATLLLKSGTKTERGTITRIGVGLQGQGVAVNSKGHIATVASFDDGPDTVVLLTPPAP